MNKLIAITIGDINGIGIEILLKTWKKKKLKILFYLQILNILKKYLKKNKLKLKLILINNNKKKLNYKKKI